MNIAKNNAIINVFISIIFVIIGIILVTNPRGVLDIISYVIGGALFFFGGMQIYYYFKGSDYKNTYLNTYLVTGIFSIALGLIIILFSNVFEAIVRMIIGFIIIYNGIVKLKISLNMKQFNIREWKCMLCMSIIVLLFGFYLLTTNVVAVMGVITIIYGVIDLIQNILYVKNINKLMKQGK